TTIIATGCRTAHRTPSAVWRYLIVMSRRVHVRRSSREPESLRRSARRLGNAERRRRVVASRRASAGALRNIADQFGPEQRRQLQWQPPPDADRGLVPRIVRAERGQVPSLTQPVVPAQRRRAGAPLRLEAVGASVRRRT